MNEFVIRKNASAVKTVNGDLCVGNPLQAAIKLLMSSSYDKFCQRPIVKQKIFTKGKQSTDDYTVKRINRIIQRIPITKDIALFEEHKPLNIHLLQCISGFRYCQRRSVS